MWAVVVRYLPRQPSALRSLKSLLRYRVYWVEGLMKPNELNKRNNPITNDEGPTADVMGNTFAIEIDDVGMAFVGLGRPFSRLPLHVLPDDAIGVTADGRVVKVMLREVPERTELLPNYPNPFNPETWIPFRLARDGEVVIRIYDIQGELVRELNLGRLGAGVYESKDRAAYWDGRNDIGEEVSSGIYMIELSVGGYRGVRKMCLMR
ncbi:hypothetical protein J7M22_12090 [Candidatus Poribacteria bacterium]|nr:hypothetical protein [Candidatus Poribacteria bacterium]